MGKYFFERKIHKQFWGETHRHRFWNDIFLLKSNDIFLLKSKKVAPTAASQKNSHVFPIGRYLLENAEFTYIIIECFPVIYVDKNNIQFRRVSIKKVYNF